jgi:hypothetical protein
MAWCMEILGSHPSGMARTMRSATCKKSTAWLLLLPLAAVCVGCNASVAIWVLVTRPELNSDFRGLWSFADFARHQAVAGIYQPAPLQAFQALIYPGFHSFFPFQYPPSLLGPLGWLADFSYPVAQAIWILAGLGAMVAAAWLFFAPSLRGFGILLLLAAPASLLNGVAGETGYFTAAFLLAGFALLPSRPGLAGLAFGLLTLKPQLGLLVPLALLARRDYRAMLSASLTALALISWSIVMFPAALWAEWLRQMPVYQAQYLAARASLGLDADVTVAGNLGRIGATPGLAWFLQLAAMLAIAIAVYIAFRRWPYHLAVAALLTGSVLFTPHAYAYDTIPLTAAMLRPAPAPNFPLCMAIYLTPYLLLTGASHWFLYAVPETLLFLNIIYLALNPAAPPNKAHESIPAAEYPTLGWVLAITIFLFGILTLGLGFLMYHIVPLLPLFYYTLLVGGSGATPGQRLFSLSVRRDADLGPPNLAQAFVWTLLLWVSFLLACLPFALALVGPRHRAGHDLLSGLVLVRN